jgi:hypothetical protein
MIHDLDLIRLLVPEEVVAIEAVGVPVVTKAPDIANARLRFAGGCVANVTASRVSMKRERKLRVFQPDTYLAFDLAERSVRICRRTPTPGGCRDRLGADRPRRGRRAGARDEAFRPRCARARGPPSLARTAARCQLAERILAVMETS